MKVRIGAAQMNIIPLSKEENVKKAEFFMEQAHKEDCDIICFPELFLTGPLGKENLRYAEEIPGYHTERFCRLAREYGLHVVMGTIVEREGGSYYNTSTLIDDSGEILGKYRKIKLWVNEKTYIDRGDEKPTFKTRFGKIGLIICWDLAFPEISKELVLKGAKIVFCPSFWLLEDKYGVLKSERDKRRVPEIDTESIFVDTCVPARAIENEVVFVYVNGCGIFKDKKLIGRTQIATPFYGRVALAEENEEKLVIKVVDINLIKLAERVYEIKKDSIDLASSATFQELNSTFRNNFLSVSR